MHTGQLAIDATSTSTRSGLEPSFCVQEMNPVSQSSLITFVNWIVLLTWLLALLFYVRKKFRSWSHKETARQALRTSYVDATESLRRVYELRGWSLLLHGDVQDTFEILAWLRVLVEQGSAPNAPQPSAAEFRAFNVVRTAKTIQEFREQFRHKCKEQASGEDLRDGILSPLVGAAWWMAETGQQRIAHLL